ncbi:cysteine hydrolase family protein [Ornithinimicrobium panacihumi]|uniref:cysteine hydrolase family protein n=1 Tax=Ornithinimicrobium panacihumi TaxID=2008449 RepID=UPI003F8AF275
MAGPPQDMAPGRGPHARPALIVVDVQRGFDDAEHWGVRDNLDCERNIEALLAAWRERARPVVLVRHDSAEPGSPLAPGAPGNDFKDVITGEPDLLVAKSVNSSFHGSPDLEAWLRGEGIDQVVVCGITTNHCCETTARVAGNLGFQTWFVIDATHTFGRAALDGSLIPAQVLSSVTAANLHGEFATVTTTRAVLDSSR